LAGDVLNAIMMIDEAKDPACGNRALYDTGLLEDVEDGTFSPSGILLSGKWLEVWTINRCGSLVPYAVQFNPDGAGGTYYAIGTQ
jgi:hypothetical protein